MHKIYDINAISSDSIVLTVCVLFPWGWRTRLKLYFFKWGRKITTPPRTKRSNNSLYDTRTHLNITDSLLEKLQDEQKTKHDFSCAVCGSSRSNRRSEGFSRPSSEVARLLGREESRGWSYCPRITTPVVRQRFETHGGHVSLVLLLYSLNKTILKVSKRGMGWGQGFIAKRGLFIIFCCYLCFFCGQPLLSRFIPVSYSVLENVSVWWPTNLSVDGFF